MNEVVFVLLRSMSTSLLGLTPQRKQVDAETEWMMGDVTFIFPAAFLTGLVLRCAVNKQLADKERVAAALENSSLLEVVNQCLTPTRGI